MGRVWNWFVRRASIRKKLIISYMVLVSIPILILGYYSFSTANQNLVRQTEETMENNLSLIVTDMEARFQRENDFTKYLAYNLEFRETLEDNAFNSSAIAQSLNKTVEPVFWYFIASDENIKAIKIVTPCVTGDIGSFLEASGEYEQEEWYQKHKSSYNTEWSVEDGRLYATRTILDTATTSQMIGILRTEFFLNRLLEPLNEMDFLENGILVKDRDGQTVYGKELKDEKKQREIEKLIAESSEDQAQYDGDCLLKTAHIDAVDWEVYYFIDRAMISEQMATIISSTLLMVGICIGLVVLFVGVISEVIGSRILRLRDQAERIADGDLENPCFTTDTDEIGVVTNSLGRMTERLNEMINEVYKIEIEKKASELKALQAQINPHFLYNCLSTIKWKALRKGDDDISGISGLIAKFYRTSLNNGEQITTVRSELENIAAYVEIQKKMHDDGFAVEYRLDEEGQDCEMPNFLLQPVVENAVKHGIDYVEENKSGLIIVEFKKEEHYLLFHIYNNGPLIKEEEIENVLLVQTKGYGIHNIKERIELYYGADCGIWASTVDDSLTCFTVRIRDKIT